MQDPEAAGHIAPAARKQAEMDAGVPLAFFFLSLVQTMARGYDESSQLASLI